jgi:hypothetical protein
MDKTISDGAKNSKWDLDMDIEVHSIKEAEASRS